MEIFMKKNPPGIKVIATEKELKVSYDWFRFHILKKVIILVFCILWYRMLIHVFPDNTTDVYRFLKFIFFFCIPAAALTYLSLALFFNKTIIKINPDSLSIIQKPFPWTIATDIALFKAKKNLAYKKMTGKENLKTVYILAVGEKENEPSILIQSVREKEVLFIKEEIEKFLNICLPVLEEV